MATRTLTQNKALHTLLGQAQLLDEKSTLVRKFTNSRTASSSEMEFSECQQLIDFLGQQLEKPAPTLDDQQKAEKQRRTIISMAHEMRWQLPGTAKADMARINAWCVKYGTGHKPLNDYTATELTKLVTQFRRVHKSFMDELNRVQTK